MVVYCHWLLTKGIEMIGTATSAINSKRTTWDVLNSLVGSVSGPADWSSELDHYLYGTPKRVSKVIHMIRPEFPIVWDEDEEDAAENAIIVESGIIQTAIAEIENGGSVHFKTVDEMMKWLDED